MKLKKLGLLAVIALYTVIAGYSFDFKPTVSLIGSYTFFQNHSQVNSGIFDIENRKANFGFEVTHKFYVKKPYFVRTGIRYKHYKKVVTAQNQIPELFDYPAPFLWERRYEGISIPIMIGKDFITKNGNRGDFHIGFAPGILMTSYAKNAVKTVFSRRADFHELVSYESWDTSGNVNPSFFFPTIDLGINYSPIKKLQSLSIGVRCMVQLNKAQYSEHYARHSIPTMGYDFYYDMRSGNSIINASVILSYTFGEGKKKKKADNWKGTKIPIGA